MCTRLRTQIVVLVLASLTSRASTCVGEDWPTHQGNVRRNAAVAELATLTPPRQLWVWRANHPPQPAWSGPAKWDAYAGIRGLRSMRNYDPVFHAVSVGDAVFVASSVDDAVHCFAASDGARRWSAFTNGPVRMAPTISEGRAYFGSDDGFVYCVRTIDGQLIWRREAAEPSDASQPRTVLNNGRLISRWPCRTGVLLDEGRQTAYFGASLLPWDASFLCAVDAESGEVRQPDAHYVRRLDGQTLEGPWLLTQTQLIVPRGRVAPLLFHRGTGEAQGELSGGGGCFVVVAEDDLILHGPGNKTGWITASKASTRERVATYAGGVAMAVAGGRSYLLTDQHLAVSDLANKKMLWQTECREPLSMVVAKNVVFVGGQDQVVAYSIDTGQQQWAVRVHGRAYGLVLANGRLLASTDEGVLHCFDVRFDSPLDARDSSSDQSPTVARDADAASRDETSPDPIHEDAAAKTREPDLLGKWVFQPAYFRDSAFLDLAGRSPAKLTGPSRFVDAGKDAALLLTDRTRLLIHRDHKRTTQPQRTLTVEAVCRIDQPQPWGAMIGAIQDNGAFERGWLLGYRNQRFCFGLASAQGQKLTYLTAPRDFALNTWAHVAGVYDGAQMQLYVNGALAATSDEQQGDILYPPQAFYELGGYHDQDEDFPMIGGLAEARVYQRALSLEEIQRHAELAPTSDSQRLVMHWGPCLRFLDAERAEIAWSTPRNALPQKLRVYDEQGRRETLAHLQSDGAFRAVVDGLRRDSRYEFSIVAEAADIDYRYGPLECDTFFNYRGRREPDAKQSDRRLPQDGLALIYGAEDEGDLAIRLAERTRMRIHVWDTDARRVARARARLLKEGWLGGRIIVTHIESWRHPPSHGQWANVAIWRDAAPAEDMEHRRVDGDSEKPRRSLPEFAKIVRPFGGLAIVMQPDSDDFADAMEEAFPESSTGEATLAFVAVNSHENAALGAADLIAGESPAGRPHSLWRRGKPPGAGEWTHLYGAADNSAFGGETLQDARSIDDLQVQWIGRPGARYQADRNGRKPSPLAAGGRLYLQGLDRLLALDSFNGAILWSWELPNLRRFNMPRDCANWCADADAVYLAHDARLWRIAGADGEVLERRPLPEFVALEAPAQSPEAADADHSTMPREGRWHWGYVARIDDVLLASAVRADAPFRGFWGGADQGWYDARSGPATFKVCGDWLFASNPQSGEVHWRRKAVIVHATITAANDLLVFAECRSPEIMRGSTRRIGPELFDDLFLVAVDLLTGQERWEQRLENVQGQVALNAAYGAGRIVVTASGEKHFDVRTFEAATGKLEWKDSFPWKSDNHGGHMSRPAIVGGTLYVRPRIYELTTGLVLTQQMPMGSCGTYSASTQALFFRAGNVTMWDRQEGKATAWSRLRPDCWLSTIPANGMLLSPEGGGGCSCGSWLETSMGFLPRSRIQSTAGPPADK